MTMNSDHEKRNKQRSESSLLNSYSPLMPLLLPLAVAVGLVVVRNSNGGVGGNDEMNRVVDAPESHVSWKRWLQGGGGGGGGGSSSTRKFDIFFSDADMCRVNSDVSVDDDDHQEDFEPCNVTKFPTCQSNELICYNRRPSRSRFYNDTRQPWFFIDYRNVYCYPNTWQGCSSCTPGRMCYSEKRCIFEDDNYPCAKWF